MNTAEPATDAQQAAIPFLGLAPFLRVSIAGIDLKPISQEMLANVEADAENANLWMNLSVLMQCIGQRDLGLAMQDQALALQRLYHLAAAVQPATLRLLMIVAPGDLSANTPLDCLLENSDIDMDFYYASAAAPLPVPMPEHDALVVAVGESDATHALLAALEQALAHWPKPIINLPQHIPATGRTAASLRLQDVPGLLIPPTLRVARSALQDIATGVHSLPALCAGCDFPIILRPVGSHAGIGLERIDSPAEIGNYLLQVDAAELYLSRFIDYSGPDGLFRKFRIALLDGAAFACHMAVSSHWMVHYLNAGMYDDAQKRAEEAHFMQHFEAFAQRHRVALEAIYSRTGLDYLCIDCAETPDGQLFIFEIDPAMVVHAMDPEEQFPYKKQPIQKLQTAFRDFLLRRIASHPAQSSADR